jgi:putative PIN family toxin of toxin-antitoxin system
MIRVVLDTNVVVSSVLASGPPRAIFDLAVNDRFAWFVTQPILVEYSRVLEYPRLKIRPANVKRTLSAVHAHGRLVTSSLKLAEASDEADNRFLECAQECKANYLVTGNLKHFPRSWKYTKVISPRDFLFLWQVQQPLDPA